MAIFAAAGAASKDTPFYFYGDLAEEAPALVSMGFTIPIFLCAMISGQFADRLPRHVMARRLKFIELLLMTFAAAWFFLGQALPLILTLALMGAQTAFFQPVRFALMPQYFPEKQLARANGAVQAGTFIAIVTGLGLGGYFVGADNGRFIVSAMLIGAAGIGFVLSTFFPEAPPPGREPVDWNIPKIAYRYVKEAAKVPGVLWPILANGCFWMVGAMVLANMPIFMRDQLGGTGQDYSLLNAIFALGAGLGSIIAGVFASRLKEPKVMSAIALLFGTLMLICVYAYTRVPLDGPFVFFSGQGWPLIIMFVLASAANGVFSIPMLTSYQAKAPKAISARIMGVANMTNGFLATVGAILASVFRQLGADPSEIFLIIALMQLFIFLIMYRRYQRFGGAGQDQSA
ncbi:MAG: MFS transporter [Pseudomonadota bacterium]